MKQEAKQINSRGNKRKQRGIPISIKISLMLGLVLVIIFSSMTAYVTKASYNQSVKEQIQYDRANNIQQAQAVELLVEQAKQANNQAVETMLKSLQLPASQRSLEELARMQSAILLSNEYFLSGTICFEPQAFDGKDSVSKMQPIGTVMDGW